MSEIWVAGSHIMMCAAHTGEGKGNQNPDCQIQDCQIQTVKSTAAAAVLLGMSPLQVVKWDDTSLFQHLGMPSQLV
jgi:hypothetical protein